jgi:tRNA-dihydrouridine synthase
MCPDKIVLANGGINSAQDGAKILQKHPTLDGLGIARGAWGRPWIFDEIKKLLNCVETPRRGVSTGGKYDFKKIKKIMLNHAKLIQKEKGQHGLFEIRKHMSWYVKGFPGASELRRKLVTAESLEEIKKILS